MGKYNYQWIYFKKQNNNLAIAHNSCYTLLSVGAFEVN
jgi:hypothetical protein